MHFTLGWHSSLLPFFPFVNSLNLTYPLVTLLITSPQPHVIPKSFLTMAQIKDPCCNLTCRSGLCLPLIRAVKNSPSHIVHCEGSPCQLSNASESLDHQSDDCTGPPCIFTNHQRHVTFLLMPTWTTPYTNFDLTVNLLGCPYGKPTSWIRDRFCCSRSQVWPYTLLKHMEGMTATPFSISLSGDLKHRSSAPSMSARELHSLELRYLSSGGVISTLCLELCTTEKNTCFVEGMSSLL